MTITPEVTILMPVYNGERYLREAIESVLEQTLTGFEFLIINDGSTDNSAGIIDSFKDSRIRLVHNHKNVGVIDSLNIGLSLANGEYIVRMDADDISFPDRIAIQVDFMKGNRDVIALGSSIKKFDGQNNVLEYPLRHDEIYCKLLFGPTIAHPSVILNNNLLKKEGYFYSREYPHAEDYELWTRIGGKYRLANLPDVLLRYRVHPNQICATTSHEQGKAVKSVQSIMLGRIGIDTSGDEIDLHYEISTTMKKYPMPRVLDIRKWLERIFCANDTINHFDDKILSQALAQLWFRTVYNCSDNRVNFSEIYNSSVLSKFHRVSFKTKLKFMIRNNFLCRPSIPSCQS